MVDLWVDLLPVLLAMMISPARTLAVIILLHTPRSTVTALGYVAGMVSAMMVQGALFGAAMSLVGLTDDTRADDLAVFLAALFVIGGLVLLVGAFKIATAPAAGGGSLASLLDRLEHIDPSGAFKIGFGWLFASPKQWVFVLTAVAIVVEADLRTIGSLANFALFTILVQAVYFVVIAGYAAARQRVEPALDNVFGWIKANLRTAAIGLFSTFGVIFLIKGLTSLG